MKIFGRNKEKEDRINKLEKDMQDIREVIIELMNGHDNLKETFTTQFKDLSKDLSNNYVLKNDELMNSIPILLSNLQNDIDVLNERISELEGEVKISEEVSSQSSLSSLFHSGNKPHLFKFNDVKMTTPYNTLKINNFNQLSNRGKTITFTIEDVIHIKNNLQNYHDNNISLKQISDDMNIKPPRTVGKIIWNIEEGNFDELIEKYEKGKKVKLAKLKNNHVRKVAKSAHIGIDISRFSISKDGKLYYNNRELSYNMDDVISLKDKIYDLEKYPTLNSIKKCFNVPSQTIDTLIWRIEEGYYDGLIDEYENNEAPSKEEGKYHIYKLKKSYQAPLFNLSVGQGGVLYNKNNQELPYTIQDVMMLKEKVYSGKYNHVKELYTSTLDIMSRQLCLKLIWNIEEGNFDELIEEYNSRKYTYENKNNKLYIDGENSGLTIEQCNLIIDCVINDPNKQICVNNLIKNYSTIAPKFIRILADEYNNINLGKVLKKETKKVEKVDNPQKRREQGYYG